MPTLSQTEIDQASAELMAGTGSAVPAGEALGVLYLERNHQVPREKAIQQIAFGSNDYGLDGFHVDPQLKNLYLYEFKWSPAPIQFRISFQRLIEVGLDRVFGQQPPGVALDPFLLQLKSQLLNYQGVIERVFVHLVFNGDPQEAEHSMVYEKLREDLEGKKYLLDQFFGKPVTMVFQFLSAQGDKMGAPAHQRVTHQYPLVFDGSLERSGPAGEVMHIGFARLTDLHAMYAGMNYRFFERNIRASLSQEAATNRSIRKALSAIVLEATRDPLVFAFDHNGVTLFAEKLEVQKGRVVVTEPRMLNGAQTIATFDRFLKDNASHPALKERTATLEDLRVMCKIITDARSEFILEVTVNNNRQNPVKPWNLHANDMIQLELQDKFRQEMGIYYERQESAFVNLSSEELDDLEIKDPKALELLKLAQTFLASDGALDKLSRLQEVFEEEEDYRKVFGEERLEADSRKILLCYKVRFRLNRLIREIMEKGEKKYAYMRKARNLVWALLCQGLLNDEALEENTVKFGKGLGVETGYTEWLAKIASAKVRFLIAGAAEKEPYASKIEEERYEFLKTDVFFAQCMEQAGAKWGWQSKRLVG